MRIVPFKGVSQEEWRSLICSCRDGRAPSTRPERAHEHVHPHSGPEKMPDGQPAESRRRPDHQTSQTGG